MPKVDWRNKFKVGSRVIYTSGNFGDAVNNPLWNGKYGQIVGTIIEVKDEGFPLRVRWDNGWENTYRYEDLEIWRTFKIGDVVKVVKITVDKQELLNKQGKVVEIADMEKEWIGVEFFEFISGHSCNGLGREGFCYYLPLECLQLVTRNEKRVIISYSKKEVLDDLLTKYPKLSRYFKQ